MATQSGDRSAHFPAIEAKHGRPMSHWFDVMRERADEKYPEQVAFLREEHGFSQAHANALVLYCRGSTSSRRFESADQYFEGLDPVAAVTMRAIFAAITDVHPDLDLVIAWNQPMLRTGKEYVFGASAQSKHLLLGPWGKETLTILADRLAGYTVNVKTVRVPLDWEVDAGLLRAMVDVRLAEIARLAG